MKHLRLFAPSLALLLLAGCSSMSLENKRVDYQAAAIKAPSLEVPPDLTAPAAEDHYTIPGEGKSASNYSEFAGGAAPQQAKAGVLPETGKVRMEHNGAQRWLVVEDTPESVWPSVRAFWPENGFVIKDENKQAGLLETDWAENRAKIPKTGLRSIIGRAFDDIYDSGEKDRYSTRLERGKDGKSTEIYIAQYGIEEVQSADKKTFKWQPRANDPALEATMLQLLMVKLGGQAAQATEAPAGTDAQDAANAPKLQAAPDGTQVIALPEPFDKSWRKVGLALEHAGLTVEDKNRDAGVYFLSVEDTPKEKGLLDKLSSFWNGQGAAKTMARYRVTVQEGGAGCIVAVSTDKGEHNSAARQITDTLYKSLGSNTQP
jgi:outer membrane protein assembly factor BamC